MSVRSSRILVTVALALALMPKVVVSGADTSYNIRFLAPDGGSLSDDFQFDPQAPTFFVVSGFRDTGLSDASLRQANAIQQSLPQANVIVVAWYLTPPSEEQGETQKKKSLFDMQAICNLFWEYQDSVRATTDRETRSEVLFDLELVRQLSPSSNGRDALNNCLRDVVFDIEIVLCELGSDTFQWEKE